MSRRDFGIRLYDNIVVNKEVDGRQHFYVVCWGGDKFSDPDEQAKRDGDNCRAAVAVGVWVIRYYQPHIITEKTDWREYRRQSHSYIVSHGATNPLCQDLDWQFVPRLP